MRLCAAVRPVSISAANALAMTCAAGARERPGQRQVHRLLGIAAGCRANSNEVVICDFAQCGRR